MPPESLICRAASSAPFAMLSPSADCFENGALTAIRIVRCVPDELPQPAVRSAAATTTTVTATLIGRECRCLDRVPTEVGRPNRRIAADLVRCAFRDRAAGVEDGDAVGDRPHQAEVVLDDEQPEPAPAQR